MIRILTAALCAFAVNTSFALAEGREFLGHGRLVNNDLFGDFQDRWQSGSVAASRVRGYSWNGIAPERPFDLLEFRIGAQVMAPENIRAPAANDRPWAGALSFGVHTHFNKGATEFAVGGDLVVTGPQNGLSDFQTALHDGLGVKPAAKSVLSDQVENGVHPTFVFETGQPFALAGRGVLRPYAELRWGAETLARVGADLTFGAVGQGELMVRDPVTGQRYRAISQPVPGVSFVMGGDVSWVDSSVFLPASKGVQNTDTRTRLRAGMHWQGERNAAFYGLTWLSEEFEGQPEGQILGSMRFQIQF